MAGLAADQDAQDGGALEILRLIKMKKKMKPLNSSAACARFRPHRPIQAVKDSFTPRPSGRSYLTLPYSTLEVDECIQHGLNQEKASEIGDSYPTQCERG